MYGKQTFEAFFEDLCLRYPKITLSYYQSNHEGGLIDKIHEVGFQSDGIVLNAGAYTHTSIALADTIGAVTAPVIEVHISNVHARESYRHHSWLSAKCAGVIVGLGLDGYRLAIDHLIHRTANMKG